MDVTSMEMDEKKFNKEGCELKIKNPDKLSTKADKENKEFNERTETIKENKLNETGSTCDGGK